MRNLSHMTLPKELRNVTLYLHIGALPKQQEKTKIETSDEQIYRRAYLKKKKMSIIEKELKKKEKQI